MHVVWYNHGLSCVRDALVMVRETAGPGVTLLASHRDPSAPALAAADVGFVEPRIDRGHGDAAYVDWLLETARRRRVDLLVAQSARGAVADRAAEFAAQGVRVATPAPSETLALIEDKGRFYARAAAAGLPTPLTIEVGEAQGFDDALAQLRAAGVEACVKPPKGVFGAGFWRLVDDRGLLAALMNPDARTIAPQHIRRALAEATEAGLSPRLLVMELLPGVEWSVDCLADRGRMIRAVARAKLGRAQRLETDGPAIALAGRAVSLFALSGLVNVQMKDRGAAGREPALLEINPRMSGGCLYTRHAGINLPWAQVALQLGLVAEAALPTAQGGALVATATISVPVARATRED